MLFGLALTKYPGHQIRHLIENVYLMKSESCNKTVFVLVKQGNVSLGINKRYLQHLLKIAMTYLLQ